MKILLVKSTAVFVDIEKSNAYNLQELGLAKAFNRIGHSCDVVYYGKFGNKDIPIPYNEKGDTFTFHYLKATAIFNDCMYHGLSKLITQFDIVHVGGYDTLTAWVLSIRYPNKVVIYNGTYFSAFNKGYNKKCKIVDAFLVPFYRWNKTQFDTKSHLSELFLRSKGIKNVVTIGVGIDLSVIEHQAEYNSDFIETLKSMKKIGQHLLLYIGRIEPRRNIKFMFDILKEAKKDKEIKLVLIGKGEDSYKAECFEYAKSIGVDKDIIYKDFMDQKYLKAVYEQCCVFLLPTIYEIFGMVLLEAMYYKLPVISTLNGGSDLMIQDKGNGFIAENNNTQQWREIINSLIKNPQMSRAIGQKAHATIAQDFTWDALAVKFIKVFENKIDNAKK